MEKLKKLEYQSLKNLGVSQESLEVYSNSDYDIYQGECSFVLKIRQEYISNFNTITELDNFLKN